MGHTSYLRGLAHLFYQKEAKQLYRYRFFFPNKRSGNFFLHYLRQASGKEALLLPEVTTLGTFLRRAIYLPEESVNNELLLLYHLYNCYKIEYQESEYSFETFYDIGKQLLADFNDIDNHLADPKSIFDNMDHLDQLTVAPKEFLTQDQIDALSKFALDFNKHLDSGYSQFWKQMPNIYARFKDNLRNEGLTYNGMLMRDIVEKLQKGEIELFKEPKVNVFIGLNALSKCEQSILRYFREHSDTLFYWDYDSYLLQQKFTQKSREESRSFPEPTGELAFERDKASHHQPQLHIISIPSKLGQANYISQKIIPQLQSKELIDLHDPNTAIILPDESQLTNLLSNLQGVIPGKAPLKLNITMGFPIKYLPAIAKLLHLLNLQRLAYIRGKDNKAAVWRREELIDLLGLELDHSDFQREELLHSHNAQQLYFTEQELSQKISKEWHPDLRLLFYLDKAEVGDLLHNTLALLAHLQEKFDEDDSVKMSLTVVDQLLREIQSTLDNFVAQHHTAAQELTLPILHDLIHTTISRARIPFAGEPLEGVQIMGLLEARSIDFQNIIVLDAGEGLLPAKSRKYGLIPQNIRAANGLPTYQWQDDIRAYNFFHMINRSERLYALYDSRKTERASGEPSRYLTLLTHIYGLEAKRYHAYFPLTPIATAELRLNQQKIQEYRAQLTDKSLHTTFGLSPSALINYLTCPRKFYYQNILKLREPDEPTDLLEKNDLGTITHKALELLYQPFVKDQELTQGKLEEICEEKVIIQALQTAYNQLYQTNDTQFNGYFEMYKSLMLQDIQNTIQLDIDNNLGFKYIGGEQQISTSYTYGAPEESINLRGIIDRIDRDKEGKLRLVDYKTGHDQPTFSLANSFDPQSNKIDRAPIQLLTYCVMYLEAHPNCSAQNIAPLLFKVRKGQQEYLYSSDSKTEINRFSTVEEEFKASLNNALLMIAKEDTEFLPNNQKNSCDYCAGRALCSHAKLRPNR